MIVDAIKKGSVVVLRLHGRLTIEEDLQALQEILDACILNDAKSFLVDMSRVRTMDAFGIGQLVTYYKQSRSHGGSLKLLHLNGRLRHMLKISRLLTIFESFDKEDEALASFPVLFRKLSEATTAHPTGRWLTKRSFPLRAL
jgi:anti-sigma B factor antagonist